MVRTLNGCMSNNDKCSNKNGKISVLKYPLYKKKDFPDFR